MNPLPLIKFFLLSPLRKAATIPVVAISLISGAALIGSFDLSRGAARLILRPPPPPASGGRTDSFIATSFSVMVTAGLLTVREVFGRPFVPPPPSLPTGPETPLPLRLQNAAAIWRHVVLSYPYRFRFASVFLAGSCGGVAYAITEKLRGGPRPGGGESVNGDSKAQPPRTDSATSVTAPMEAQGDVPASPP